MKIGFIILAHKNPLQLERLMNRLWHPDSYFLVHIDMTRDASPFWPVFAKFPNDRLLLVEREASQWGTFGLVKAPLNAIREGLDQWPLDYFVLISAQDYPLVTVEALHAYFETHRNKVFLESFPLPDARWQLGGASRFPYFDHMNTLLPLHGGSQWWSMPATCGRFLLDFLDYNPDLLEYFRFVFIADETFFHSVLHNCEEDFIVDNIVNNNLRHIVWSNAGDCNPKTFTIADFEELSTSDKLIARKFDIEKDVAILDAIDRDLLKLSSSRYGKISAL
ncbi:beta-1,6-N-acetylglucosaminyltransferase [Chitinophaga sp.]|uniref:beta-1,6-N-acetylglucosaminyltransferase n=1 Tax=Chitinophaga sp. TaxID=1869181 RepID=UPI0031E22082